MMMRIACLCAAAALAGAPAAALDVALRYLDAYHGSDRVWKELSAIRGLRGEQPAGAVPPPETGFRATGDQCFPNRKG